MAFKFKSLILASSFLAGLALAAPAKYTIDKAHSEVGFKVSHLVISSVKGSFNKFDGAFDFDEAKNTISNLVVNVETASVDTREEGRDKHLRTDDFFGSDKHPKAVYTAKEVKLNNGKGVAKGELSMKGKKKAVDLDINYKGKAKDAWGNEKLVFEATGKVNRKDFDVSWNKALDSGGVAVGEEVTLEISAQAVPAKKEEKKK